MIERGGEGLPRTSCLSACCSAKEAISSHRVSGSTESGVWGQGSGFRSRPDVGQLMVIIWGLIFFDDLGRPPLTDLFASNWELDPWWIYNPAKHTSISRPPGSSNFRTTILADFYLRWLSGWQYHHFGPDWNIWIRIAMKFCTDILFPKRWLTDFGDPPARHPVTPTGQSFHISCKEVAQYSFDRLAQEIIQTFMVPQMMNHHFDFSSRVTTRLWFWVKCVNNYWMDSHRDFVTLLISCITVL